MQIFRGIPTMQVELNSKDLISLPMLGHVIFGTDESCDVKLELENPFSEKVCSIINDKNACILEVLTENKILINQLPIKEMAILHPGDTIHIEDQQLTIINENNLPKECTAAYKLPNQKNSDDQILTSVSGIRSFNKGSHGELFIIGDQNSFTHKPTSEDDIPFSVSYLNENLTLLCKKNETISINGNKANYVILRNGDYISTLSSKYCVESPGTSSFSKYSPSHPRNIQLSEEYQTNETSMTNTSSESFLKKNLWWITLVAGLGLIALVIFALKNN